MSATSKMLRTETLDAIRAELALPAMLPLDLAGLRAVYRAWCGTMTFDNIRKVVALKNGEQALPGLDAEDYFQNWLANRSGGTCWPSSNALFALFSSYGFDARLVAGSMYDLPDPNHGTVRVRIGELDFLTDSGMLTVEPIPLDGKLLVKTDGPVRVEVEYPPEGTLVWADFPPTPEFIPCRLRHDPVDAGFYRERYEASRQFSPFNERLYLRKLNADGMDILLGNMHFRRSGEGLEANELSADGLCTAMHEIGGVSEALISRWADAGGLEASMNPTGPGPDFPDCGPRPSRRV